MGRIFLSAPVIKYRAEKSHGACSVQIPDPCLLEFLFLGANIDAVQVAGRFGIKANRAVRYEHDGVGTRLNYEVMSKAVSFARSAPSAADMECALDKEGLLAPIREDYKRRHKR